MAMAARMFMFRMAEEPGLSDRGKTMNILVLNYEYPPLGGGGAQVCRDLAEGMAQAGHRVTVVTMGYPGLPARQVKRGVEIFRLKCLRKKEHACKPWEACSYILAAERFLQKHLRGRSYDVCHTHFILPTGPVAEWVRDRYGIPYIITAHGSDVEGHNRKQSLKIMHRMLRPAWKRIVKKSYAVAAPSVYLQRLMNGVMKSRRYIWISNGIDIEKYKAEPGCKTRSILLMGRMQESKNYQTVLRAVAEIPPGLRGGWQVDILGDGPYRKNLEDLCASLGIEDCVRFRGWIENGSAEQLDYLRRASVFVSASRFENCPVSVLEAVAAGCRPLLSDIEGHRQFFGKGPDRDQYFFAPDDADGLAEKLQTILIREPGALAPADVDIHLYDSGTVVRKYLKLLKRAASGENSRPARESCPRIPQRKSQVLHDEE